MQLVGVTLTAAVSGALGVAPRPPSATSTSGSCLKRSGQRRKRTKAKNGRVQSNMKTKKVSTRKQTFLEKKGKKIFPLLSLRTGFEPVREDPIGFQVQRLNHSAIAAALIINDVHRPGNFPESHCEFTSDLPRSMLSSSHSDIFPSWRPICKESAWP